MMIMLFYVQIMLTDQFDLGVLDCCFMFMFQQIKIEWFGCCHELSSSVLVLVPFNIPGFLESTYVRFVKL